MSNPALLTGPDVQSPAGALSLRAGALRTLFTAFSEQSLFTGLFVDEFTLTSASNSSGFPDDQRDLSPAQAGNFPFQDLSGARINGIIAVNSLKQSAPQPGWHIAELYALIAAAELEFDENLCSGVPVAVVTGMTPAYGSTLSRQQLLRQALVDLDSAAAYSGGSDSIANLTAVLRGRALADSGNLGAAAQAVSSVPIGFVYEAELSDTTSPNQIYEQVVLNQVITVSDREGINGLPFVSAVDPRVPIVAIQGGSSPIYTDANATNGSAPLTMASGVEAQLLTAEAALSAGQINQWATTLNNLRQNAIAPAMQALTTDSTTSASPSEQVAVMFRERAFWLFETGHRHGDLRRLVRQYGLSASSVFPIGPYFGGPATYGPSVVYPVAGEQVDPNYHGCIDTSA